MSKQKYIEWDVPIDSIKQNTPIGFMVELSQKNNFRLNTQRFSTFYIGDSNDLYKFSYSKDEGDTWQDFPSVGEYFDQSFKMRLWVKEEDVQNIFVLTSDGLKETSSNLMDKQSFSLINNDNILDIDLGKISKNVYMLADNKVYIFNTKTQYLKSFNTDENTWGIIVDEVRDSLWEIGYDKVTLKDLKGNIVFYEYIETTSSSHSTNNKGKVLNRHNGNIVFHMENEIFEVNRKNETINNFTSSQDIKSICFSSRNDYLTTYGTNVLGFLSEGLFEESAVTTILDSIGGTTLHELKSDEIVFFSLDEINNRLYKWSLLSESQELLWSLELNEQIDKIYSKLGSDFVYLIKNEELHLARDEGDKAKMISSCEYSNNIKVVVIGDYETPLHTYYRVTGKDDFTGICFGVVCENFKILPKGSS